MKDVEIWSSWSSRRCLLGHVLGYAAGVVGAAAILGATVNVASAGKMSQSSVGYQPSPQGSKDCSNCKLFQSPNACRSVDGAISPQGWCRIWIKA